MRQPWAWAIAEADEHPTVAKVTENRTGGPNRWRYRGPLLVHAGLGWSDRGADSELVKSLYVQGATWGMVGRLQREAFTFGAVLCVAELADAHPAAGCCEPWGEQHYVDATGRLRTDVVHLVLEDVRRLPEPIPCTGRLGLWHPSPELAATVQSLVTPR